METDLNIKFYNFIKPFFKLYVLRARVPITANISVTDRCNFRCSHCKIPARNLKELTKDEIFLIVDQLQKAGTLKISLCGGEPLMRQDIGEIINYIKSKKIMVNLVSNGGLVRQKIDELLNLDFIMLSYDGSAEAQKDVRGEKASDVVLDAIDAAGEKNICVVTATVLTKNNLNEVDSILEMSQKKGIFCQFHPIYSYILSGESVDGLLPDRQDLRKIAEKLIRIKNSNSNKNIVLSVPTLEYLKGWPEFKKQTCWAGISYVYIDTDGRIYPCMQMIKRTEGVSLLKVGLQDAIKKMERLPCSGCWCLSNIEYNYLFSFNIKTCLNSYRLAKYLDNKH